MSSDATACNNPTNPIMYYPQAAWDGRNRLYSLIPGRFFSGFLTVKVQISCPCRNLQGVSLYILHVLG